jgi:hypothetical protein
MKNTRLTTDAEQREEGIFESFFETVSSIFGPFGSGASGR